MDQFGSQERIVRFNKAAPLIGDQVMWEKEICQNPAARSSIQKNCKITLIGTGRVKRALVGDRFLVQTSMPATTNLADTQARIVKSSENSNLSGIQKNKEQVSE